MFLPPSYETLLKWPEARCGEEQFLLKLTVFSSSMEEIAEGKWMGKALQEQDRKIREKSTGKGTRKAAGKLGRATAS